MRSIFRLVPCGLAIVLVAFVSGLGNALAQQYGQTLKQRLVGTWMVVSVYNVRPDGSRFEPFGPSLRGMSVFTNSGRFVVFLTRTDLPRYASNDRFKGTVAEYQATVQGNIAYFGTYVINTDGSVTERIEGSSFPNWVGADQKRQITINEGTMDVVNPTPTIGGTTAHTSWKRVP